MTEPVTPSDSETNLPDRDDAVLKLILGERTCKEGLTYEVLWYVLMPLAVTLLFLGILMLKPMKRLEPITDNRYVAYVTVGLGFFLLALALDMLITNWKLSNVPCNAVDKLP